MSEEIMIEDETFSLVRDTFEVNYCDCCFCRKGCDWWENVTLNGDIPGYAFCRDCSEKLREGIQ